MNYKLKKLGYGALSTGFLLCALPACQTTGKPNIVLIFLDDQGYGDLGVYGAKGFQTPTIDSLASKGIRFTNFYVSQAVSSASRASLMTGCYANRVGICGALTPNSDIGISEKELTIAEMLKAQGYATGIFGKWHLGDNEKFLPLQHGFDEYVGLPYSNDMWPVTYDNKPKTESNYPTLKLIEGNKRTKAFNSIEDQNSITTMLTEKAIDFVHRHSHEEFFLYFPHPMPHVPLGVSEKYAGKSSYGSYGDVIMEIDWSVQQLTKALEEEGIAENTLIIFTSDNGPWKNYGTHAGTTGGLREGKGTSWEGGQRVPCIMTWPGHIPENKVINQLATTMDILPTLAEISGGSLSENKIDGVNILPLLMGDTAVSPRKSLAYYYNDNDLEAVREGNWKLVFPHNYRSYEGVEAGKNGFPGKLNYIDSELELYNLKNDPFETNDLLSQYPEIVEKLQILADSFRMELGDYLTGKEGKGNRNSGFTYEMQSNVEHKAVGIRIDAPENYHIKYSGRGPNALVDGAIARPAFKDRAWQAYYGEDMSITLYFDKQTEIDTIEISTLKNEKSWIFLPSEINIEFSEDGSDYHPYGQLSDEKNYIKTIGNKYAARFVRSEKVMSIRIFAENRKVCPPGHPAEGKPAWIFFDEIIVK